MIKLRWLIEQDLNVEHSFIHSAMIIIYPERQRGISRHPPWVDGDQISLGQSNIDNIEVPPGDLEIYGILGLGIDSTF